MPDKLYLDEAARRRDEAKAKFLLYLLQAINHPEFPKVRGLRLDPNFNIWVKKDT